MGAGYNKTTEVLIEFPELAEGLPLIIDDFSLASKIGIRNKTMWYILVDTKRQYKKIEIPKKTGGKRTIHDPKPLMKYCQSQLLRHILNPLQEQLGEHVTAYRKEHSIRDAVEQHIPKCPICDSYSKDRTPTKHNCPRTGTYIRVDLKDFFPSTRSSWIRNYFKHLGYSHEVSRYLGGLMTVRDLPNPEYTLRGGVPKFYTRVPQGSPASGAICNLVANYRMDNKIIVLMSELNTELKLSGVNKWKYTRYSDDLAFTCGIPLDKDTTNTIVNRIYSVINTSGYLPNKKKTKITVGQGRKQLLGVVFNVKPNISKKEVRRLRAIVHNCLTYGFKKQAVPLNKSSAGELLCWLSGKINWVKQINTEKGEHLLVSLEAAAETHGVTL